MKKGKWFLVYTIDANGSDGIGDFSLSKKVKIRLFAKNENDARGQAKMIWEEENIPSELQNSISDADDYNFVDPYILYEDIQIFPLKI